MRNMMIKVISSNYNNNIPISKKEHSDLTSEQVKNYHF